jgi:cobalamin synthase
MFAKPDWFRRRKYGGWGVCPHTWQGWVFSITVILPLVVLQSWTSLDPQARAVAGAIWLGAILLEFFDIMRRLPKDEREVVHEAFAERNALWAMIFVLVVGLVFRAALAGEQGFTIDPLVIAALAAALLAKAATNLFLDRRR